MGANDLQGVNVPQLIDELLREFLQPPQAMSCADWADDVRKIAKGPERGDWRTARTPYLREPMNCTDPEHPCQKIVMQFATQLGKSEVIYNAVLKRIHLDPVDMMMVLPTLNDAKDHSRERFMPTVRAMPEVAKQLPDTRSRDETNTWQTKQLASIATLFFAGANSARSLASKPLGFAATDEIDGYPLDVDGEGDPLGLVWERMSNFAMRKLIMCSTPTIKDFSRIEAEYLESDRRRYWVACPHCSERQVLVWGADADHGIKWSKTLAGIPRPETAVYICEHCARPIRESSKRDMLEEGIWIPDNPGAQRGLVVGFHLNKLYSPLGWKSWPMLVDDWLKAKSAASAGDVTKLKTFVNTSLAETWEEQGDRVAHHELQRRAGNFPLRQVQNGMYVCTQGVDTQGDRLEVYTWAWGRGMERQLVDFKILYGDPSLAENEPGSPWAALTEYRRTPILHVSGKQSPVLACFIDSGGHHTHAVYTYARAHQHAHVYAVKGASIGGKAILGKPSDQDVSWQGQRLKRGVKLWPIGTDSAKAEIYGRLRITEPGPGYVHLSRHLPSDVFEQLTAERMVTRYVKGRAKLEWVKPNGRRNEALDCSVYALAAAIYVGIDRWKEGDWAKWHGRVAERDLFDLPPEAEQPEVELDAELQQAAVDSAAERARHASAQPSADPVAPLARPAQPFRRPANTRRDW